MAIEFNCPHCGESYRLKDELAGKRATCKKSSCRKAFTVPAASHMAASITGSIPVDAEAMAAAALLDDAAPATAPQEKKPQGKIKLTCATCDHVWEVERSMEGKNVPCPECRKIVRVPVQKEEKPADWRTGDTGRPSLAKREEDPKMEGVWGGERSYVKADVLAEAGALPVEEEEAEPVSKLKRIRQIFVLLAVLGLIGLGVMSFMKTRKENKQERSIADAVKEVEAVEDLQGAALFQAAILRSAGEQRVRAVNARTDLEEAELLLTRAIGKCDEAGPSPERDALLMEIAVQLADLGGSADDVRAEKRREWIPVQRHIRQTLQKLGADRDAKLLALRRVARRLAAKQQGELAVPIAIDIIPEDVPEAIGQIGMELLAINQKEMAQRVLDKAVNTLNDSPERVAQAPALTALRIALGGEQPALAGNLPLVPPPTGALSDPTRIAYAEGWAAQGKFDQARTLAERAGGGAEGRVRALAAVAAVAVEAGKPAEAAQAVDAAARIITVEMKGSTSATWIQIRLAGLAARAGKPETAATIAEAVADEKAKSWAKLEAFRGRLAAQPEQAGQDTWLEDLGDPTKPKLVQALAREALARHNARIGQSYDKTVDSWPKGVMRPFGSAGLTLGSQDRSFK